MYVCLGVKWVCESVQTGKQELLKVCSHKGLRLGCDNKGRGKKRKKLAGSKNTQSINMATMSLTKQQNIIENLRGTESQQTIIKP